MTKKKDDEQTPAEPTPEEPATPAEPTPAEPANTLAKLEKRFDALDRRFDLLEADLFGAEDATPATPAQPATPAPAQDEPPKVEQTTPAEPEQSDNPEYILHSLLQVFPAVP